MSTRNQRIKEMFKINVSVGFVGFGYYESKFQWGKVVSNSLLSLIEIVSNHSFIYFFRSLFIHICCRRSRRRRHFRHSSHRNLCSDPFYCWWSIRHTIKCRLSDIERIRYSNVQQKISFLWHCWVVGSVFVFNKDPE